MTKFKLEPSRYSDVVNKCLDGIEQAIEFEEWEELKNIYKTHGTYMTKSRKYLKDNNSNETQIYVAKLQYAMSQVIRKYLNYVIHDHDIKFDRDTCYECCIMEYYKYND